MPRPTYSIIAPVFNEQEVLPEFYRRMKAVMDALDAPAELILVFDGSRDRSPEIGSALRSADPRVKIIDFSRNFGHQIAITAGIDFADGDAVVIIDSDLQDPPEVIHDLARKWKEGYEVVYAQRNKRPGETFFKLATAKMFYKVIGKLSSIDIPQDTGDFRLIDRKVVLAMRQMRERHRFMRGLSAWVGYRQTGILYDRHERHAGATHYPIQKMVKFACDAITSFSYLPLQLATTLGFWLACFSLLMIPAVIALRFFSGKDYFYGQATTLIVVLFIGGVQLVFLGIMGEYLGRIYDEVKRRPLYFLREAPGQGDA